jgi:hypothetical protein
MHLEATIIGRGCSLKERHPGNLELDLAGHIDSTPFLVIGRATEAVSVNISRTAAGYEARVFEMRERCSWRDMYTGEIRGALNLVQTIRGEDAERLWRAAEQLKAA